jgi:hypothetical protein
MEKNRRSRKEWIVLLNEMSKSGLTQVEWCRQNNINYKTMRAMKDKIKKILNRPGSRGQLCFRLN